MKVQVLIVIVLVLHRIGETTRIRNTDEEKGKVTEAVEKRYSGMPITDYDTYDGNRPTAMRPPYFYWPYNSNKPATRLVIKRTIFPYMTEQYSNWSLWSNCSAIDCTRYRYRQCTDDSWRRIIINLRSTSNCPVKYIMERQRCTDISQCQTVDIKINGTYTSSPLTCGENMRQFIQQKVLGGKVALRHRWPWHVGLHYKRGGMSKQFCGGTLIAPEWIVTAGHCIQAISWPRPMPLGKLMRADQCGLQALIIRVADHDNDIKEEGEQDLSVSQVVIHPEFQGDTITNKYDIALVKITEKLNASQRINFACLPNENMTLNQGTICVAVGWGQTNLVASSHPWMREFDWIMDIVMGQQRTRDSSRMVHSRQLNEVNLPLVSIRKCRLYNPHFTLIEGVHICAGTKGKDTCRGDSGGGLYCRHPASQKWMLYGVTNFGSARGCGRNYGVYANVPKMVQWIQGIITRTDKMQEV